MLVFLFRRIKRTNGIASWTSGNRLPITNLLRMLRMRRCCSGIRIYFDLRANGLFLETCSVRPHCIFKFLFIFLVSLNSYSQKDSSWYWALHDHRVGTTPFDKIADANSCALKGKILPLLLGNDGGFNALLGFEFGFLKNHSIGIDGYFLHYGGSRSEERRVGKECRL